ncbi:MAG: hypothetical protein Q9220_007680, partial [cf. Caloplaca sp. 1 TL-2023]
FSSLPPALPPPSPYLGLTYTGFTVSSPDISSSSNPDPNTYLLAPAAAVKTITAPGPPGASHFNLTSMSIVCIGDSGVREQGACDIQVFGTTVQMRTAQGGAAGGYMTKSVHIEASGSESGSKVRREGGEGMARRDEGEKGIKWQKVEFQHWEMLETVGMVGKRNMTGEVVGVGVQEVVYWVGSESGGCDDQDEGGGE